MVQQKDKKDAQSGQYQETRNQSIRLEWRDSSRDTQRRDTYREDVVDSEQEAIKVSIEDKTRGIGADKKMEMEGEIEIAGL